VLEQLLVGDLPARDRHTDEEDDEQKEIDQQEAMIFQPSRHPSSQPTSAAKRVGVATNAGWG
jgi:hypothetical protein